MTYNRMEAKADCRRALPVLWRCLGAVGEDTVLPAVVCCDTAFVSLRGSGQCQVEHERFSLCYSHYEDQHGGPWESCQKCRDFWSPRDYKTYAENPIIGQDIEGWNAVHEVQIPGTKIEL